MKKQVSKYLICILIIMFYGLKLISKIFENDLFFDIKTGETILKYGIDFKDHFSFIGNLIYIYHHWLYDLIVYKIHYHLGFDGLFIFFLITFTIFGIVVFHVNGLKNKLLSLLVTLFTMCSCAYAFSSRVQSITYILLFLEVYFFERLYKTGQKKYSIYLIVSSIIIANLHMPMWFLCIVLGLPYITETLFHIIFKENKSIINFFNIEKPDNSKIILITFICLLFTGLLTPLKLYPYMFFTKVIFNNSYLIISEMGKTILMYFMPEIFIILVILIGSYLKLFKFSFRDFLLIIGLFVFSLLVARNVSYFLIIIPTILAKSIDKEIKFEFIKKIINQFNEKTNFTVVLIFMTTVLIIFNYNFFIKKRDYGISSEYPDKIVNYIKSNLDYKNLKIYNDFNNGSYLEFNDIPVFIDSRAEVYMKEFNGGHDIISDYKKSLNFQTYKEVFNKYNFDYVIVHGGKLYNFLKVDTDYELVMEENEKEKYFLFKRKEI